MTLGRLVEIGAFKHSERLQEISGQASSEASLESILKKVGGRKGEGGWWGGVEEGSVRKKEEEEEESCEWGGKEKG